MTSIDASYYAGYRVDPSHSAPGYFAARLFAAKAKRERDPDERAYWLGYARRIRSVAP